MAMKKFNFLQLVTALLSASTTVYGHEKHEDIEWLTLGKKLPNPTSDMTATVMPRNGDATSKLGADAIIITGGCTSVKGNEEVIELQDGVNTTNYYCMEYSKQAYAFYPSTEIFQELSDMPVERYRHTAEVIDGKLYVIGGRGVIGNDYDALIKDIYVYDPSIDQWSKHMALTDEFATSDHGSFVRDGKIHILGGYNADYSVTHNFHAIIDVKAKTVSALAPMGTRRGDTQAVYYNYGDIDAAYVMGGFTSLNGFCSPLDKAEMYDFKTGKWSFIDSLSQRRGDKVALVWDERILTVGGEDKHESLCTSANSVDPSSHAQPVDDVESYDPREKDEAEWEVETDLVRYRFRAAGVSWDSTNTIYLFGGQATYSPDCKCFKTTSDIFAFRYSNPNAAVRTKSAVSAVAAVMGMITVYFA